MKSKRKLKQSVEKLLQQIQLELEMSGTLEDLADEDESVNLVDEHNLREGLT